MFLGLYDPSDYLSWRDWQHLRLSYQFVVLLYAQTTYGRSHSLPDWV